MPTNISDFIAQAQKSGFTRPNFFEVVIGFPPGMQGAAGNGRLMTFFCKTANIPPQNILTASITEEYMPYDAPYGASLDDVTLEFYVDEAYIVRDLFQVWSNLVYNQKNATLGYMEEYAGNIIVTQLNRNLVPTYSVNLLMAFPKSISAIALDRSANDSVATVGVTFSYKYLEAQGNEPGLQSQLTQQLGQGIFEGQLGSTISSLISGQSGVAKDVFSGLNTLNKSYVSLTKAMNIFSPADQAGIRASDLGGILADTRTSINPFSGITSPQYYKAVRTS